MSARQEPRPLTATAKRRDLLHSHTTKGSKRYRYYVCVNAQKRGWRNCPSPSIPAAEIENFIVDQIRAITRDPAIVAATLAEATK